MHFREECTDAFLTSVAMQEEEDMSSEGHISRHEEVIEPVNHLQKPTYPELIR